MTICAYQSHKKLLDIKLANEKVSMQQLFSKLLSAASEAKVKKLQISADDSIFKLCRIEEFKKSGNEMLRKAKNLSISIIKPPKVIENDQEKLSILEKFAKFVRECENCKLNKHKPYTKEEMILTETPEKPFDSLIIDLIGPLAASNGKLYIVTIICDLTKYLVCVPVTNKTAKEVAKAIFQKIILVYGPMKSIRTDKGTEFTAKLIGELCELMGIEQKFSTAYHHQSLGTVERNHSEFNKYMRQYMNENLGD